VQHWLEDGGECRTGLNLKLWRRGEKHNTNNEDSPILELIVMSKFSRHPATLRDEGRTKENTGNESE
jgi:hypothetical protein